MIPEQLFKVGDIVRIVYEPYRECPFNWMPQMDECCGIQSRVREAIFSIEYNAWRYRVDGLSWAWCENCFVMEADIEESANDISILLS